MAVWYLDNDDEITDAVARLRDTDDAHVVFVVPPGSRIATGRINFRLLAREADARDLLIAVASPDEQVRALATSAGVLTAATPDAAEAALERGEEPAAPDPEPVVPSATAVATAVPDRQGRWSRRRLTAATLVVLGVAVAGGYVALETVPTADISLTPSTSSIGPISVPVVAAPGVEAVDAERGRVPAVELSIPLRVQGTFEATGSERVERRATGRVVFESDAQAFDQEIAAGTRLRTPGGVEFQTTESATLPRAVSGASSQVTAAVEAVAAGDSGNVPIEAISVVPSLESQGIRVRNPQPTSGGRVDTHPRVTVADYDAAAVDLRNRLAGALAGYLRDPTDVPDGLTLFAETARQGPATLDPPAEELVGSGEASFELVATAVASALAVDVTLVEHVTRDRLQAALEEGTRLLPGSIRLAVDDGVAEGDRISFTGTASGRVYQLVDDEALRASIAGVPIPEARAILEAIGQTTVNVWPEFVSDLPDDPERIRLEVREPSTTE